MSNAWEKETDKRISELEKKYETIGIKIPETIHKYYDKNRTEIAELRKDIEAWADGQRIGAKQLNELKKASGGEKDCWDRCKMCDISACSECPDSKPPEPPREDDVNIYDVADLYREPIVDKGWIAIDRNKQIIVKREDLQWMYYELPEHAESCNKSDLEKFWNTKKRIKEEYKL